MQDMCHTENRGARTNPATTRKKPPAQREPARTPPKPTEPAFFSSRRKHRPSRRSHQIPEKHPKVFLFFPKTPIQTALSPNRSRPRFAPSVARIPPSTRHIILPTPTCRRSTPRLHPGFESVRLFGPDGKTVSGRQGPEPTHYSGVCSMTE